MACGLEVTKVQMVAAREEWVQALGWPKARLAGAAIYSWGRWTVTMQSLRAASSSCLKGTCLCGEGNLSQLCWVQIWTLPLIERPHLSAKAGAQKLGPKREHTGAPALAMLPPPPGVKRVHQQHISLKCYLEVFIAEVAK